MSNNRKEDMKIEEPSENFYVNKIQKIMSLREVSDAIVCSICKE
jgi:hypothetical protein